MGRPKDIWRGCETEDAFISTFRLLSPEMLTTLSATTSWAVAQMNVVIPRMTVVTVLTSLIYKPYLTRLPRMSRVSSLVMERVAALVAFFTTRPVAEVFDFVFLPVTLSLM